MNQKVIWCISKYALPPKWGAQGRMFFLSDEFNKMGHNSYTITSSSNHLIKNLPPQKQKIRTEIVGQSTTLFLKGSAIASSVTIKRVFSWFVFEWRLFWLILFPKKYIPKPDVVIVSSLSLLTVINGFIAKKKFGCQFIFEVRDIWPLSVISIKGYSKNHPLVMMLRWVEKFGYRRADVITSPIPNLKQHIAESIKKPFQFCFIPQGFNPEFMADAAPMPQQMVAQHFSTTKFNVGYIGNIVTAYNLDMLIECAKKLAPTHPHIHFFILGDGTHKPTLQKMATGLTNITFLPRIPKNQVQHFLSQCHIVTNFFLPENAFRFGVSPQKLVDYMFAAKPVLMSYTGYKSIVQDANCGMVVPANDVEGFNQALLQMINMPSGQLQQLGQNGKQYLLTHLTWQALANRYIALF